MGSRFTITPPDDYVFARDVCSYGYFLLAPNRWDPRRLTLQRTLDLEDGPAVVVLAQPRRETDRPLGVPGAPIQAAADRALSRREVAAAKRLIARMLSLDDPGVAAFHAVDVRWSTASRAAGHAAGRARLFRSPTFFEDVVKTVTSCNVTWPGTVGMNRRLCEQLHPGFPSPAKVARTRASTLRARCRVGYRDQRLIDLARLFLSGEIDEGWFTDPANDDAAVYKALLGLPGVGPYAASNILQLLGRHSRLPIDTEAIRHGRQALGMEGTDADVGRRLEAHYAPFGEHKFRSYWFEIWEWYESRRGPSWTWDPDEVGSSFTAAKLRDDAEPKRPARPRKR